VIKLGKEFRQNLINRCAYLCIPIILLIRVLRPLVCVRFGWVQSHKIGHYLIEAEFYLLETLEDAHGQRLFDLFYDVRRGYHKYTTEKANLQTEVMARRHLRIHPWVAFLYQANRLVPGWQKHEIVVKARDENDRDRAGLFDKYPIQIALTDEEYRHGEAELRRMGIPPGAKFVCVHCRDSSYWKTRYPEAGNDSEYRNTDIDDFVPAIRELTRRGFYVLRLGAVVQKPLHLDDPKFIDYSTQFRSEFMDVFLAATCHLMISTSSGIDSISYMFRRPTLLVNIAPVGRLVTDKTWIMNIPKLHRWVDGGKLLRLSEVFKSGADSFLVTDHFTKAGIEPVNCDPEVIRLSTIQMLDMIAGTYRPDTSLEQLQARHWSHYTRPEHFPRLGRVSDAFLSRYRDLID
jgi:putative glycosyltransferase (TIGR04372 family)